MMRDGAYTLVQQIISPDRKVIKTTGANFMLGAEIILGPSYLATTAMGEMTTSEDSQYAIVSPTNQL